ncbi:MAG: hypothetical protein IKG14_01855 [Clostridia bacterium]|nr:hypothetical protein [Bacilli bacterium]MBR3324779.1 hypothetical protein [Clostridia bacterium]
MLESSVKEKAMNMLLDELSGLMDELMYTNDENESVVLKEKIDLLEKMKEEVYKGNERIINKILKAGDD